MVGPVVDWQEEIGKSLGWSSFFTTAMFYALMLAAVPAIDPKEFAQVLTLNVSAQVAMIQAFDAMLRAARLPADEDAGTPALPAPQLDRFGTGSLDEAAALIDVKRRVKARPGQQSACERDLHAKPRHE